MDAVEGKKISGVINDKNVVEEKNKCHLPEKKERNNCVFGEGEEIWIWIERL